MANPDFPQNREEMLLNAIAGSPYDVPTPVPQSRVEKWLAFLAENGIPGNVKIGDDVATVADLPAEGAVGEMHFVTTEGLFYVWKLTDGTGEWIPVGADFDPSEFARSDGTYPDMTVGKAEYADVSEYSAYAEQLDSNQKLTVSSPFVFRPAGGGADVEGYLGSKATIAAVYGNTLVWNQLIKNGNFADITNWSVSSTGASISANDNVLTFVLANSTYNRFYQAVNVPKNHKVLFSFDFRSDGTDLSMRFGQNSSSAIELGTNSFLVNGDYIASYTNWTRISAIFSRDLDCTFICIGTKSSAIEGSTWKFKNFNAFDLTAMFGAGNEPATVGEFRAMFPLPYYAYDAGRLLNFTGTGIKTVGFNALTPDGTAKLLGGKAYEIVGAYTALSYSTGETIAPVDGIFTPSADGILTVTGADAETCVHLVWSGYRNGETAPYHAETKEIPVSTYFSDGMKSVGDVRDELMKDKAIKRCGIRTYQDGDESDPTVVTDGTNTIYALDEAVETPIDPPLDLTFTSSDYGTEMLLLENGTEPTTTPMHAAIDYVQNLRDKLQRLPNGVADGDYYVHSDGVNQEYKPLPVVPNADGVYTLKCTVASGTPTFAWVADTETQTEPPVE